MGRRVSILVGIVVLLLAAGAYLVLRTADPASAATCARTVASAGAAADAVRSAKGGDTICLADGTYERIELDARPKQPGVVLRAQHPGRATVAGVAMAGRNLTVAQLALTHAATVMPGSSGMRIDHDLLIGGGRGGDYGVFVCPADPPDHCDDVTISHNRFSGRFDEDAIRANVYHDGPDRDHNGLLIEGNEFTGNVEYGGHNDVFQSVWVGDHLVFRKNYLHDFGGQGFFVKDQASAINGLLVEDNLIVNQDLPCDPTSLCPNFQLSPLQIFGPIANGRIRHNTVWPGGSGGVAVLRGTGWSNVSVTDNVFGRVGREPAVALSGSNNTTCHTSVGFTPVPGTKRDCHPRFHDRRKGDYRVIKGGRGIDWRVADQRYGPAAR
jgi:hypothetical protein